jgi:hypothetical protein
MIFIFLIILLSIFNLGCNSILGDERGPAQQSSQIDQASSEEIPATYFIDEYMKQSANIMTRYRNFVIRASVIDLNCGVDSQFSNMFNLNFYYNSVPSYLMAFNFQSDTGIQGLIDSGIIKSAQLNAKLQLIKNHVRSNSNLIYTEQTQNQTLYQIRLGPKSVGQWVTGFSIIIELQHQSDNLFLVTIKDDSNVEYVSSLKLKYYSELIYNSLEQAHLTGHPRYP